MRLLGDVPTTLKIFGRYSGKKSGAVKGHPLPTSQKVTRGAARLPTDSIHSKDSGTI